VICTFFGHRDCYGLDEERLRSAIGVLIQQGTDTFYVGNQGSFDSIVRSYLKMLQGRYPHIRYHVVLAYLPVKKREYDGFSDTVFPEEIASVHPKFAIDCCNRYLIDTADICLCYVNQTWGGVYKFARLAKCRGLRIFNLGSAQL